MIEKLLVPAVLFATLSPGFFTSMKTSVPDVFLNALILVAVYWCIARVLGLTLTKADLIVPAVMFLVLSPGFLVTLPPGPGGIFMSRETSTSSIVVHTIVFTVIFATLRKVFPKVY
jgi:hypothetical protein